VPDRFRTDAGGPALCRYGPQRSPASDQGMPTRANWLTQPYGGINCQKEDRLLLLAGWQPLLATVNHNMVCVKHMC
jgi:hypothetical protein